LAASVVFWGVITSLASLLVIHIARKRIEA
jgi:hypothetical protein